MTWGGVTVGSEAHEHTVPRGKIETEGGLGDVSRGGVGGLDRCKKIITKFSKTTSG